MEPAPVSSSTGSARSAANPILRRGRAAAEREASVYELKIVTQMAAAHQLREFSGKCENLHGHNWKIEIYVTGQELGSNGILIDFKLVKDSANKIIQDLDHTFLNDLKPFEGINPSSENIARFVFSSLSRELNTDQLKVSKVTAWESDSACATYMEP